MKKYKAGLISIKQKKNMRHGKKIITVLLGCCLLLCSPLIVRAKDYSKAKYDRTRWSGIREDYLDTETDRLIFVKYEGGSDAVVEMWKKVTKKPFLDLVTGDGSLTGPVDAEPVTGWEQIVSCRAYTGANGLGKEKAGDRKTPTGIYQITMAFGRKKSPGTAGIPYTKLNKYHYWSDERETYNQFIDVRTLGRSRMSGEHLISYNPHYNYALALDYNKECTYLKGSAIFLHCFGSKPYTAGCVAVSEKDMKRIVQNTTRHTKICIYKK